MHEQDEEQLVEIDVVANNDRLNMLITAAADVVFDTSSLEQAVVLMLEIQNIVSPFLLRHYVPYMICKGPINSPLAQIIAAREGGSFLSYFGFEPPQFDYLVLLIEEILAPTPVMVIKMVHSM
jgi:hypothetical protein